MNRNIIEARANRVNFRAHAGIYYVDDRSELIINLMKEFCDVYFGISRHDSLYTVIGGEYVLCRTLGGKNISIPHNEFLRTASAFMLSVGKASDVEFITLEGDAVWVLNVEMLSAISNVCLLLCRDHNC